MPPEGGEALPRRNVPHTFWAVPLVWSLTFGCVGSNQMVGFRSGEGTARTKGLAQIELPVTARQSLASHQAAKPPLKA